MPVTTMDRFSEAQEKLLQRRVHAFAHYPALWNKVIAEWNSPNPQDGVWLTYSANYLFRTNHVRWAIDPLTLYWRLELSSPLDFVSDLSNLSFVLLTHAHHDHLDLDLLSALRQYPIRWVIPEFMLSDVIAKTGLPRDNITVPTPLCPFDICGIQILPFNGFHWENTGKGSLKGVPALGYLVEAHGRRWLFPGDTRNYNVSQLPVFPGIDVVFAHLWLGRGAALADPPPLLDSFCRFFLDTGARQVIITHLHELGRDANDSWGDMHVRLVRQKCRAMGANIPVSYLQMGESVSL